MHCQEQQKQQVHHKFLAAPHSGSPTAINIIEGKAAGSKG